MNELFPFQPLAGCSISHSTVQFCVLSLSRFFIFYSSSSLLGLFLIPYFLVAVFSFFAPHSYLSFLSLPFPFLLFISLSSFVHFCLSHFFSHQSSSSLPVISLDIPLFHSSHSRHFPYLYLPPSHFPFTFFPGTLPFIFLT